MPKPIPQNLYLLSTNQSYYGKNGTMYCKKNYYNVIQCGKPIIMINHDKSSACYYPIAEAEKLQIYLYNTLAVNVEIVASRVTFKYEK
jgi:hypothetical protein